jgi:hypothetical protein
VEISAGSFDYTNPDALVTKFAPLGEGETFISPVKAVEAAIAICEAWRRDGCPKAQIGYGANGGMTMPFDPCTYEEARTWAAKREEQMPRCDHCGELLPEQHYTHPDLDDQKFCREFCVEEAFLAWSRSEPSQVCDDCLLVAYDKGARGRRDQEELMMLVGADLEDHDCTAKLEPDLKITCYCACNKRR